MSGRGYSALFTVNKPQISCCCRPGAPGRNCCLVLSIIYPADTRLENDISLVLLTVTHHGCLSSFNIEIGFIAAWLAISCHASLMCRLAVYYMGGGSSRPPVTLPGLHQGTVSLHTRVTFKIYFKCDEKLKNHLEGSNIWLTESRIKHQYIDKVWCLLRCQGDRFVKSCEPHIWLQSHWPPQCQRGETRTTTFCWLTDDWVIVAFSSQEINKLWRHWSSELFTWYKYAALIVSVFILSSQSSRSYVP